MPSSPRAFQASIGSLSGPGTFPSPFSQDLRQFHLLRYLALLLGSKSHSYEYIFHSPHSMSSQSIAAISLRSLFLSSTHYHSHPFCRICVMSLMLLCQCFAILNIFPCRLFVSSSLCIALFTLQLLTWVEPGLTLTWVRNFVV